MFKKQRYLLGVFLLFIATAITPLRAHATVTSYSDAYEFYESSYIENETYHSDTYAGTFYYATSEKLASSSTNLKFVTVGFDVTLEGNGESLTFQVKRNGNYLADIPTAERNVNGRNYTLYKITDKSLHDLAYMVNQTKADKIFGAKKVYIYMNAIMTTKQNGSVHGSVTEDGKGGLVESGRIKHLNNSADLKWMKSTFTGSNFSSYINIAGSIINTKLQVCYKTDADTLPSECTSTAVLKNPKYIKSNNYIYTTSDGKLVISEAYLMEDITFVKPSTFGLAKDGYHLPEHAEWIRSDGASFDASISQRPINISPLLAEKSDNIILTANWQPNNYTVVFNAAGGYGTIGNMKMTYDKSYTLPTNIFYRDGYHLVEGSEWIDANGKTYASCEVVSNLTTENNGVVTLFANWEPNIYTIVAENDGGTGLNAFYERYDAGFHLTKNDAYNNANAVSSISAPIKVGYDFIGYFEGICQTGQQITSSDGKILVYPNFYSKDGRVFAAYNPIEYTITFDKQGGTLGTDYATAIFGEPLPSAVAPYREGYSFRGYFTKPNGQGVKYYNDCMASMINAYNVADDLTLYAYWVDDVEPFIQFCTSNINWTNEPVTLTAYATDSGVGLKKIEIYTVTDDYLVAESEDLTPGDGEEAIHKATLKYVNVLEGAIYYKAVAYDLNGNTAEAYATAYYDITSPRLVGTPTVTFNGNTFILNFTVTDVPGN